MPTMKNFWFHVWTLACILFLSCLFFFFLTFVKDMFITALSKGFTIAFWNLYHFHSLKNTVLCAAAGSLLESVDSKLQKSQCNANFALTFINSTGVDGEVGEGRRSSMYFCLQWSLRKQRVN